MKRLPLLCIALALNVLAGSAVVAQSTDTASAAAESAVAGLTGDADAGAKVFRKCKACHEIGEGAKSKAGPMLTNILGRAAGAVEDFGYSSALMKKATDEELVWDVETLEAFLTKPKTYIKGTKMSFAGLRKEKDRANVIAYLAGFTE
ncbi:c-type cytochrome [Pseudophaeobacter leonis]|uniref:c-type cytochrome n=1 Tax=Pseudophaeobacter leonis TaxID=1144477 RepID=UPI0009F66B58|nr:cytochrome c family protein [Pseudophaeobacter leonis]